jgi:opacity protein-like surface antigen
VDWRTADIEAGEVETIPVQLSGLLYLVPPYVHATAGVGWYSVRASLEGVTDTVKELDDSTSDAGLHLGAGFEIPLGSRTSLTTEGRYVWLGYELEEAGDAIQVDADFLNVMAGLQFYVW